jgi:autotransporter translocation and assembly factor TamB
MSDETPEPRRIAWPARFAGAFGAALVWAVGLAVVILSVTSLGIIGLSRSPQGSRFSLTLANQALSKSSNLRIEAGRTLLVGHGARILDLRLIALDSLGVGQPLVTAREARLTTSWWGLVRGRPGELSIDLDRPVISLVRTKDGHWLVPRFKQTENREPTPEEPLQFALTMRDGVVRFIRPGEAPDTVASRLTLRGTLDRTGKRWNAAIARGAARLPGPGLALERTTGSATFEEGAFTVPRLVLRTDEGWIEMKGGGRIAPAFQAQGRLDVGEWEWRTFARMAGRKDFDVDGGVAGGAAFSLGSDGLVLRGGLFDVLWRDEPARLAFDGHWKADHLELTDARAAWRDTRFAGRFDWYNRAGGWLLDGRVERLDLAELPRVWPMGDLDTTSIGADVHLAANSGRLDARVARGSGHYRGMPFDSLAGTWALANGVQTLDARARVAGGSARAAGTIRGEGLVLDVTGRDLAASAVPARVWGRLGVATAPEGRVVDLRARLEGPFAAPRAAGTVALSELHVSGLELEGARASFDGRLGERLAMTFAAQGRNARLGPARADTAWARGRASADSIVIEEFSASRADSVLVFRGRAHRQGDAWDAVVEDLWWTSGNLDLAADGPVALVVHDDGGLDVRSAHIVSSAGSVSAQGSWGGSQRASDLTVTLETLDLEALLGSLAEKERLRGVVNGTARLAGPPGRARWLLDLTGRDVRYRQFTVPEILARGRFEEREWAVERLAIDTGKGRASFSGDLEWASRPPWGKDGDAWNAAFRDAPRWRGTVETNGLSFAQIAEWFPQIGGWRGLLDAKVELSGRPADPVATASGTLREPGWGTTSFDDVRYDLAYASNRLEVQRFESGKSDSTRMAAKGQLPIRLGWGVATEDRLPELPMELSIQANRIDLGVLTTFLPPIAAAAGKADFDAKIVGTPKHPSASGRLLVVDGAIRPAGREEVFDHVDAELTLQGDELRVVQATARQGKNGRIEVKPGGLAKLKDFAIDDYLVEVTAREVTAFASGEYVVRLDGEFRIEDGARLEGPLPLPHITGTARVIEGVFLYNFGDAQRQAASQGPVAAPPWTYDVFVEADNNLWYRPSDANIEGKLEDFEVIQRIDRFLMLGQVEAIRGRYFFLGSQFSVDEGRLFFDNAEPNNPTVDATLTTEKATEGGRETITLNVTGRAFEPKVTLTSEPGALSQSEIVQLLTFGQLGGGAAAVGNIGAQYLMNALLRQELREVTDVVGDVEFTQSLADEYVSGDPTHGTTTTKSYAKVGVSRYFTRDLLVRYSQVVGDVTQATSVDYQDLTAEYRLNRLLFLSGQVTRRRGVLITTTQEQTIYRFDVHARHEY